MSLLCTVKEELENDRKKRDKIYFEGKALNWHKLTFKWQIFKYQIGTIKIMQVRNQAPNLRSFSFHWRSKPQLSSFRYYSFGVDPWSMNWEAKQWELRHELKESLRYSTCPAVTREVENHLFTITCWKTIFSIVNNF